jgi:hypothetical protein
MADLAYSVVAVQVMGMWPVGRRIWGLGEEGRGEWGTVTGGAYWNSSASRIYWSRVMYYKM